MSREEFFALLPRQAEALLEQFQEKHSREERLTARLCALIANCHRGKNTRSFREEDFMATRPPADVDAQVNAFFGARLRKQENGKQ